jgi:hypothetical protein
MVNFSFKLIRVLLFLWKNGDKKLCNYMSAMFSSHHLQIQTHYSLKCRRKLDSPMLISVMQLLPGRINVMM